MNKKPCRLTMAGLAFLLICSHGNAEFMSLASNKANIRKGPGTEYPVIWQAWRFTPFEILELGNEWAKVKDFENDIGWIHQSLLSDVSTVIVMGKFANIRKGPGLKHAVLWIAYRGYPLKVLDREEDWLKVSDGKKIKGWIFRTLVWGSTKEGGG
ncbi:MAG: SH3 domain-containing protein [Elusimicrobia bacterium]|nr:SH3 domain-containing protein [Elusimicrobiota bacterium]